MATENVAPSNSDAPPTSESKDQPQRQRLASVKLDLAPTAPKMKFKPTVPVRRTKSAASGSQVEPTESKKPTTARKPRQKAEPRTKRNTIVLSNEVGGIFSQGLHRSNSSVATKYSGMGTSGGGSRGRVMSSRKVEFKSDDEIPAAEPNQTDDMMLVDSKEEKKLLKSMRPVDVTVSESESVQVGETAEEVSPTKLSFMKTLMDKEKSHHATPLLFQLPSCWPTMAPPAGESTALEGKVGELLVHASGKCQIQVGDIIFDMNEGTSCNFFQNLVLIDPVGFHASSLSRVEETVVVTPNIEQILSCPVKWKNMISNLKLSLKPKSSSRASQRSLDEAIPVNTRTPLPDPPTPQCDNIEASETSKLIDSILNRVLQYSNEEAAEEMLSEPMDVNPLDQKIQKGLLKIQKLDEKLEEKSKGPAQHGLNVDRDEAADEVVGGDQPGDDTNTFVTQKASVAQAEPSLEADAVSSMDQSENHRKLDEPVSKKIDFIRRNIQLAGEKNYFYALTEEEKTRVGRIMSSALAEPKQEVEEPLNAEAKATDNTNEHVPEEDNLLEEEYGYLPIQNELLRLSEIDQKLKSIIPKDEWEKKSVISFNDEASLSWTRPGSSLHQFWSGPSRPDTTTGCRTVRSVFHTDFGAPMLALQEARKRIQKIDEQLDALRSDDEDTKPITRDQLDRILFECMKYDLDMKGKHVEADWGEHQALVEQAQLREVSSEPA